MNRSIINIKLDIGTKLDILKKYPISDVLDFKWFIDTISVEKSGFDIICYISSTKRLPDELSRNQRIHKYIDHEIVNYWYSGNDQVTDPNIETMQGYPEIFQRDEIFIKQLTYHKTLPAVKNLTAHILIRDKTYLGHVYSWDEYGILMVMGIRCSFLIMLKRERIESNEKNIADDIIKDVTIYAKENKYSVITIYKPIGRMSKILIRLGFIKNGYNYVKILE